MRESELASWLRLVHTPGIGGDSVRRLLGAFGPPQHVLAQPRQALERLLGPSRAAALRAGPDARLRDLIHRTLHWLSRPGHRILSLADRDYPPLLLQIPDPPPLLYVHGRAERLTTERSVAVVGTRNPTPQGAQDAKAFAAALSAAGVTVISGLARGVDAQAHAGALSALAGNPESAGSTVAVLGTGCDRIYPPEHRELAAHIAREGALISEFALGSGPARSHFPRRNRLISGLARAVLVTEAAPRSGSLITARLGAEQGRDVLAVPGSIHNPLARGCHALLREGAGLVQEVGDVLDALGWQRLGAMPARPRGAPAPDADDGRQELLRALGFEPVDLDTLHERTGRDAPWLQARLLELELDGDLAQLPGGRVQRVMRG